MVQGNALVSGTFPPSLCHRCAAPPPQMAFYVLVKAVYTLGYSVSLVSLATGSMILCLFR